MKPILTEKKSSKPDTISYSRPSSLTHRTSFPFIDRGQPAFTQVILALFSAGIATFALLYCVQPILPMLSQDFAISPANSSLALSLPCGALALGLMFTGPLSDAIGRKQIMVVSLFLAAICTLLCAIMHSWQGILVMRTLVGLALSGIAAVAMTYLSEELNPGIVTFSMGLYISGNSIGGMSGRLVSGILTEYFSWRVMLVVLSLFAFGAALMFWRILPVSKHFRATPLQLHTLLINFRLHCHDRGLPLLFIQGFLLMGSFVTLFNYISYRLLIPPYSLTQSIIGFISIVFIAGVCASPIAGLLSARLGRGPVFTAMILLMLAAILLSLLTPLTTVIISMALFSAGFFAAHSIASSWIGLRARRAKGQASSLYLFCYYLGSCVAGTLGGFFWEHGSWNGIVLFIGVMLLLSWWSSLYLRRLPEASKSH